MFFDEASSHKQQQQPASLDPLPNPAVAQLF
jgi:hypothetical protein